MRSNAVASVVLLCLFTPLVIGCEQDPATPPLAPPTGSAALATEEGAITVDGLLPVPERESALEAASAGIEAAAAEEYPVVIVNVERAEHWSDAGEPVVDNFRDAVARVQPGGTIRVLDGTYRTTEPVIIEKALTIEPTAGATPVVVNGLVRGEDPESRSFIAVGPDADVSIQGLTFENPEGHSSVSAEDGGEILVRTSTFRVTNGVAGAFAWGGARIVIEESDFSGGQAGAFANNDDTELVVRGSTFRDHEAVAVQYQLGADGLVEENVMAECGFARCIGVFDGRVEVLSNEVACTVEGADACFMASGENALVHVAGNEFTDETPAPEAGGLHFTVTLVWGATGRVEGNRIEGCGFGGTACINASVASNVEIVGNHLTVFETVFAAIEAFGDHTFDPSLRATALISDNEIVGVGGTADTDPADPDAYVIGAGIWSTNGDIRVFRNSIRNASRGIEVVDGAAVVEGSDNRIEQVHTAVSVLNQASAMIGSSDFTDYHISLHVDAGAGMDLTCNWWGSRWGPVDGAPGVDPAAYTPWATEPVAGESVTDCDGFPPEVVRVDPTAPDAEGDPPTFETMAEAFDRVTSGGTILVADGEHVVRELQVTKPVAIQAEGPGRPIIDAQDAGGALSVGEVTDGTVTIRGLEFVNGENHPIVIFGRTFDRVVIEDNVLHAASGDHLASAIFSLSATGNEVVIRGNEFLGGQVGIHADFSHGVIEDNSFSGQAVNSIRFGSFATDLSIARNTLDCGGMSESCVALVPVGDVEVVDNVVTVEFDEPMEPAPIQLSAESARIDGNTVTGVGGTSDPADRTSFPIQSMAIFVEDATSATVTGNTVNNAFVGIVIGDGVAATGLDNVVDGTSVAIEVMGGGSVSIHSSDFTNYRSALSAPADADLTCNWWGSADGPENPNTPDPSVYTPWATEPVAGTSAAECSGGL